MYGTYEEIDGKPAMRFEGGRMHFEFPGGEMESWDGVITELDPPRRFSFTWGDELLKIELEPDGDGCRLRFTQVLSSADAAARDAAGWHVCLDRLESLLSGDPGEAPGTEATSEWSEHYEKYRRRGVPAGAGIPGRDSLA